MSQSNSAFVNRERAAFEFASLLRQLPEYLHGVSLSNMQLEQIQAADKHAENTSVALFDGLQSLGRVLWSAGVNSEFPPEVGDYARVGTLVTEIALQLQFLIDFREEVAEHNLRIALQNQAKEGRA